ncbi:hypothetical protein CEE36_11380 [candidate division TA06 bacterium B3_TA06]|uniref:Uncharacterized protein n=1 Tax=candidate division TA06 bacterium B3_TA06 TaxID=2012487 RepID=A0A532UPM3_UNCT6|nr:MAG: hypothetical protein CEE36_11380 [candidate division TA06 bacterium B3_TA06]
MKFTVEYKRTVRVRQYETLTIGWMEEFDRDLQEVSAAYETVQTLVDYLIDRELGRLTKKEG